jgi:hypothetical protein
MDLTPLVENEALDLVDFTMGFVERFSQSVRGMLEKRLGR